jgi:hypothetical protein
MDGEVKRWGDQHFYPALQSEVWFGTCHFLIVAPYESTQSACTLHPSKTMCSKSLTPSISSCCIALELTLATIMRKLRKPIPEEL